MPATSINHISPWLSAQQLQQQQQQGKGRRTLLTPRKKPQLVDIVTFGLHWTGGGGAFVLVAAFVILAFGCVLDGAAASTSDIYKNARLGHRIVQTKYGRLHGMILPLDNFRFLRSVEVFLGVPYATPPTKQNRFSPTRAPAPWDGIRISDKYSPVCPQRLPNIQNETAALEKMPKGRLEYLKRLVPFLENQSEDCLYLNIFSPINAGAGEKKLPVIVFIHGESFEWSSGNPYDGSVLASYGEVVVVTLNYRLGILGFLNANPSPQTHARVANYGLMDQMAALHWIQQNIQKFGGDPMMVTLAGHGTGAACINYLMTTPTMVRGLFHRAILMSGSAYSSWALVEDPVLFAVKLAKEVNCSIPDDLNKHHEEIVDCLREVSLEDLYAADIQAPNFLTSFGPSVDGVVIRPGHSNLDIDDLMSRKRYGSDGGGGNGGSSSSPSSGGGQGFSGSGGFAYGSGGGGGMGGLSSGHYDVLFGVVTGESIWRFSAHDIQNGFEGERRDKIIRTYVRNAYNYHLNEIFYTIVNEYTDWDRTSQHPINTRDTAVAALSDAQFVAPIIRTGDILAAQSPPPSSSSSSSSNSRDRDRSERERERERDRDRDRDRDSGGTASASTSSTAPSGRCYFYVFDYQTKDGDYPQRMGTVHGEDLPYIFGAPLVDGFSHFPQNYTKSEIALSEAVIIFWSNFARTGNPNEHHRQDSTLPASKERNRFRSITWENYDPLHQKYLEIGMKPRIKNHFRAHQLSIWLRLIPELHRAGMEDVIARHNLFKNHDDLDLYEGPVKPDPFTSTRLLLIDEALMKSVGVGKIGRANMTGYMNGILGVTTVEPNMYTTCIPVSGNYTGGVFSPTTLANSSSDSLSGYESAGYAAYSTALSVTIAIGCSLLILNVLIFAGVYYQRDKTRLEVKTLQKQYQQRMHQQVPYPPEPIKHAHYHMGHSQSANVIVDVENHGAGGSAGGGGGGGGGQQPPGPGGDSGAMLLTGGDVKPPPPHICPNSGMQLTQHQHQQQQQQQQQQQSAAQSVSQGMTSGNASVANDMNVTYSTSTKQQHHHQQQQQQQQREHMQIKGMSNMGLGGAQSQFGRSTTNIAVSSSTAGVGGGGGGSGGGGIISYNAGMMTLPKAGTLHHNNSINYGRSSGGVGAPSSSGGSVIGAANPMSYSNNGDCMTLPRNLTASSRHNSELQQSNKHQPNGNIMTGLVGSAVAPQPTNPANNVGGGGPLQSHHIRAPRPPIRTASSSPSSVGAAPGMATPATSCVGGVSVSIGVLGAGASLVDQTPSNGSSSSGVSSAPSSKGHSHTHSHAGHMHTHSLQQQQQQQHNNSIGMDSIGMTTLSGSVGSAAQQQQQQLHQQQQQQQQQQQLPQAAIDEMRV